MAKTSVRIVRRRSPVKRVPADQIPVKSRKGTKMMRVDMPMPDEDEEEAMDAAADWWFAKEHGEEELKKRKAEVEKYRAKWAQNKTKK